MSGRGRGPAAPVAGEAMAKHVANRTRTTVPVGLLLAFCSLVAGACTPPPAAELPAAGEGEPGPIVLESQGSFAFGGSVVTGADGNTFRGDHGYAQFQIPRGARTYPLVMWHGGGQFGKTWETTPDGREGYRTLFLRRGFATYVIDQPRRGRAGRSTADATIAGGVPDEANLFTIFRLGLWTPPGPPRFFPGVQFPQDPDALDQYFRQVTPDTGTPGGGAAGVGESAAVATDAVAALFDTIGPAVLITHSASGILGWQTALRSRNVRAIVAYEPTVFLTPEGENPPPPGFAPAVPVSPAEFDRLTGIPIQIVFGGNIAAEPAGIFGVDLWVRSVAAAEAFVETVNTRGGDAELLHLPAAGLAGNTHFPFSDLNNLAVADLLSEYLARHGLDRRDEAAER